MSKYYVFKTEELQDKPMKKFAKGCELAGIKPTTRQLKKWKEQRGVAYEAYRQDVAAE